MRVIQTKVQIGEDRILTIHLPPDAPVGEYDVVIVLEKSPNLQDKPPA